MPLSAIIFDFDGTIVETEAMHYQATIAALKDDEIFFTYDIYAKKYIGIPDILMFPLIGERHGINVHDQKLKELLAKKQKAYAQLDLGGLPICSGVVDLVETASKAVPLGICTGAHRADIDLLLPNLDHGKLIHYFKSVVTSDDVRRTKPHPEGYLKAAQELGVNPTECLVIEDTPTGIQAGKAAGMKVLAVETTYDSAALYLADKVVNRLSGITFLELAELF